MDMRDFFIEEMKVSETESQNLFTEDFILA